MQAEKFVVARFFHAFLFFSPILDSYCVHNWKNVWFAPFKKKEKNFEFFRIASLCFSNAMYVYFEFQTHSYFITRQ